MKKIKTKELGYDAAQVVLPDTVRKGAEREEMVNTLLQKLGLEENKNYERQVKVTYSHVNTEASITEDFVLPNSNDPETIISVTHSSPTIPGHSNENKLHQAIGELHLFKTCNPQLKIIIFVGGKKENWLPYVPKTMELFFDATIYEWDSNPLESLNTALKSESKHKEYWESERKIRNGYALSTEPSKAPDANLRTNFFKEIVGPYLGKVMKVEEIDNSVLRRMMKISIGKNGKLWSFLKEGKTDRFYQERTIFNPPEVILDMLLESKDFSFKSEIRNSFNEMIVTPNLLYDLGYESSHRRTDFILETEDGRMVYIECKSAGGGEGGSLTKHITDRAREQIARSIFHRCTYDDSKLISKSKDFYWFFVLDARWRTPKKYPLKYVHVLEICGVDDYYSCDDLVDENFEPNIDFSLLQVLEDIGCRTVA